MLEILISFLLLLSLVPFRLHRLRADEQKKKKRRRRKRKRGGDEGVGC